MVDLQLLTNQLANAAVTPAKADLTQAWPFTGGLSSDQDASDANDIPRYSQLLAVSQGLFAKNEVRAASTGNLTLSNLQTVDGVALVAGDAVLVKNQTTGSENGIYLVVDGGAWTRRTDFDADADVTNGAWTHSREGTANATKAWVLVTDNPTVGTTALVFTPMPIQHSP